MLELKKLRKNIFVADFYFKDWHLIIGGYRNEQYLAEVELFNWKTKKQCRLQDLPNAVGGHSGVVLDGIPIYCGGQKNDTIEYSRNCYKYNRESKIWTEVFSNFILFMVLVPWIGNKKSYRYNP